MGNLNLSMSTNPQFLDDLTPDQVAAFKERALQNQRLSLLRGAGIDSMTNNALSMWADVPEEADLPQLELSSEGARLGPVIAEGDSWFDYFPGIDLIDQLRTLGYVFDKNYAKAGDTLENMIYGSKYDTLTYGRLSPGLTEVLKRLETAKHKIFFFSAGGNDVAGDGFAQFLNHKDSGLPPFRESHAKAVITQIFKKYLIDLVDKVSNVSPATLIVMHGYGYTIPTGKAVINAGPLRFAGPWLRPALTEKGIIDQAEQQGIVFRVIDMYNETLLAVAAEKPSFKYVDLRGLIDPKKDWVNELHLRNSAYYRVAQHIHSEVISLF